MRVFGKVSAVVCVSASCLEFVLAGCGSADRESECFNTELARAVSPDSSVTAVHYSQSCGALAHGTLAVSLLRRGSPIPSGRGNLFVYEDTGVRANPVDARAKLRPTELSWTADGELKISYDSRAVIWKQVASLEGVRIDYAVVDTP